MGFSGCGLGVSLSVDGGRLGVVDRSLWWFVGFNGDGLWVLVDGLILILRLMGFVLIMIFQINWLCGG